jgi:hypothetical protein
MEFDNDNTNIIGLDLPLKDSKGISGLFLRYYSTFAALICDTQSNTDYRIEMMTNLMIASIPENDVRDNMKQLKKQLIDEGTSALTDHDDNDAINLVIVKACMEVVGEISGYVDQYFGTSKKISVSVESVYPDGFYINDPKED